MPALARHYKVAESALDGWLVAEELSSVGAEIPDPALREEARKLAVKAILQRTAQSLAGVLFVINNEDGGLHAVKRDK